MDSKSAPTISAGILLIYDNKVLLCHPSNNYWTNTFSPPKGHVEEGESSEEAAIRECYEETSIVVKREQLGKQFTVNYTNKDELYKVVHLFLVEINSLAEVGMDSEVVDKRDLQIEEVDWCGFMTKSEALKHLFWRFKSVIEEVLL
jgi:ADP-ribose pyrophosphatase YjhB (NUDIX family)